MKAGLVLDRQTLAACRQGVLIGHGEGPYVTYGMTLAFEFICQSFRTSCEPVPDRFEP
jgi:hypothetical protein